MPPVILYLLKANLVLLLFFIAYRLLLRQLTFYSYNRFFLLAALALAGFLPLLDISWFYAKPAQLHTGLTILLPDWPAAHAAPVQEAAPSYWHWVLITYLSVVAVLAARFILQLCSLWRLHTSSVVAAWEGQAYRELREEAGPFSFWRTIYLNPRLHSPEELRALLLHEQAHVGQFHTLDVLLGQLAAILCWFNPIAWWLQRDMRQNLEFLADGQVLRQGLDRRSYQYSLVQVGRQPQGSGLVMSFNFNHIKTRIMMMNKQESSSLQKLKYLLLFPGLLAMALVVTTSKAEVPLPAAVNSTNVLEQPASKALPDSIVYFVDGKRTPAESIKNIDPNQIDKVDVLKGEKALEKVNEKGVKGVINITLKKGDGTRSTGKGARVDASVSAGEMVKAAENLPQDAVYLLNDKETSLQEVKKLSPESIKAVSVVKDSDKMVQKYGAKAKNGVVMIYTK
ncbi:M56 family metallopeptidase [Pontibacter chinhatensis]|uniref:Signal transducer regulating beta-lactamase production, contains metallopeptidase domain n=1 Tax=Pontibacter chinhatensis TaxID=1436961 RepID=A0A1I2MPC1_9BACT|nr:M56 family metallopeptidase [Pontibacter chinhatensis]SFF92958.1 Signal transducer regulating beta-lactamase production, contains metallopeptidase domain [Pontibacter chinhatensis]